jgi:hypothetical protein
MKMLKMNDPLLERIKTTEGIRPSSVSIPPPGVYWLKTSECGFYWVDKTGTRLDHPTHNEIWAVYTWELTIETDWFLAQVERGGCMTVMGSNEAGDWEGKHFLVTRVGPRIDPPD